MKLQADLKRQAVEHWTAWVNSLPGNEEHPMKPFPEDWSIAYDSDEDDRGEVSRLMVLTINDEGYYTAIVARWYLSPDYTYRLSGMTSVGDDDDNFRTIPLKED